MKNWRNYSAFFWLRIILLFCGLLANAAVLNNYRHVGSDFAQDYIAAHSLRNGVSLYGQNITQKANDMLGFSGIENFHPPFNALLFLPFSFISYQTAYIGLGIFSIFLLFFINLFTVKGLSLSHDWFLNLTCFTLLWYPAIYCLGSGQSSMIIAACLIGGWFYLRIKKTWIAGFLFAVATLIKLFPGLVLLYLFISKNWRTLFSTTFCIFLGLLATILIVGIDDFMTYSATMVARNVNEWRGFVLNHSFEGMITKLFGEHTGWTEPLIQLHHYSYLLIMFINSLILIVLAMKINAMATHFQFADYAFGLTIISMLIISPITWGHIFPVLILPLGLLLKEYIYEPSTKKLRLFLIILFLISLPDVLIARKLMAIHRPFEMPWYSTILTLGPGIGLMLLWIVICKRTDIQQTSNEIFSQH